MSTQGGVSDRENVALWVNQKSEVDARPGASGYDIGEAEVLVEVRFSGINPADVSHAQFGFADCVAGYDFAGYVLQSGRLHAERFKPGDRVCGFAAPLKDKLPQYGTHQLYHVARDRISIVPDDVDLDKAAALPVVLHTAADLVFNILELPWYPSNSVTFETTPLLIWGGASMVGFLAIQFAKKANCFPIFTTASAANHTALLAAGATRCFDYHDPDVTIKIKEVAKQYSSRGLMYVIAAVGAGQGGIPSMPLCEECCERPDRTSFATAIPPSGDSKQKWTLAYACRNVVHPWSPFDPIVQPNYEWHYRNIRAAEWAIANIGNGVVLPPVEIVSTVDAAREKLLSSAAGSTSFRKYVLKHPLQL
ncbi:hypothetical protein NQ176_g174 [Zarea fungicola]|uniref:Uncharacterized protein n=1 Tax=Zarea fungicola TaxID=93591 RepID=A0ACC1P0V1_9HYPO|nr:hypothetical protein NQ176_g174 [Lecanicillium fungicola]